MKTRYLTSLRADSAALVGAVRLGPGAPVPSCPGWLVADVAIHVGAVHRQWARLLRGPGIADPLGLRRELIRQTLPGALEWFERPEASRADPEGTPADVAAWLEEGVALLVAAFGEADPNRPLVIPAAGLRLEIPALLRGLAAETVVHRWDAQAAHCRQQPIDRELAEDGIGAMFAEIIPNHRAWAREHAEAPPPKGRGEVYLFKQTDGGGEWPVRWDGDRPTVGGEAAEAGVEVRGTASDLYLLLWRRIPAGRLEVIGDATLLNRYFELASL